MQSQFTLAQSSTTVDGSALLLQSRSGTVLCHAYLDATGGAATCTIEVRMAGGPWRQKFSFSLSGANDAADGILDTENWFEMRGRVTAISGGGTATIVAGV